MAVFNKYHGRVSSQAVNIMRGSKFGNPYPITMTDNRATVIQKFKEYLWKRIHVDSEFAQAVRELHGKDLVCCCKPLACHGDVLEAAALWLQTNLLPEDQVVPI